MIRVCNNSECEWMGHSHETVMLGGIDLLCPLCDETTEELTYQDAIRAQAQPLDANGLLPCPFCGLEAKLRKVNALHTRAECQHCGTTQPYSATEADAIAAWNHRAQPQ